jgi:hypothetical protein
MEHQPHKFLRYVTSLTAASAWKLDLFQVGPEEKSEKGPENVYRFFSGSSLFFLFFKKKLEVKSKNKNIEWNFYFFVFIFFPLYISAPYRIHTYSTCTAGNVNSCGGRNHGKQLQIVIICKIVGFYDLHLFPVISPHVYGNEKKKRKVRVCSME